jgi:hypothetical protein
MNLMYFCSGCGSRFVGQNRVGRNRPRIYDPQRSTQFQLANCECRPDCTRGWGFKYRGVRVCARALELLLGSSRIALRIMGWRISVRGCENHDTFSLIFSNQKQNIKAALVILCTRSLSLNSILATTVRIMAKLFGLLVTHSTVCISWICRSPGGSN